MTEMIAQLPPDEPVGSGSCGPVWFLAGGLGAVATGTSLAALWPGSGS